MSNRSPGHVGIIMDGNGRWARQQGKSRTFGHSRGSDAAREIIRKTAELGISTLTLFAFSTENRNRPHTEVVELTRLFASSLQEESHSLIENGVRLKFLGDLSFFQRSLRRTIFDAERKTIDGKQLQLNVAVNYGGRWDISSAVAKALEAGALDVGTKVSAIEKLLPAYLETGDIDLLIRTGGERRLSNFLLWQSAYAELYFLDTLWPDFSPREYEAALEWYAARERRFGLTSTQKRYLMPSGAG